ncbi:MAG: hypothetical protein A3F72_13895 [Bacteroidetes bacterium RIFCSPLOWO2_12_FULL_35_15]|nr:MAG: hypothetical protein A3F72_13895 [Bacteroidetes bacterium RIFCSPLOWO2_12_FULL_35_15]
MSESFAQDQHEIDSLQKVLPSITIDSSRIQVLNQLSEQIVDIDPAKSINYASEALKIAEKTKLKKLEAKALNNIGNGHYNLAEYKVALFYYIKALNIQESLGNKKGILSSSGSIGNVFLDLHEPDKAYTYFKQSLAISKELNSKRGIASSLIAIGTVFSDKKDYKKSLEYCFQAVKLFEEMDNKEAVATCYNNIADSYLNLKDYSKALFYINKAYDKYSEIGNIYGMALALNNLGDFYRSTGNAEKAIEYYNRGLEQAKKIGANDRILAAYKGISASYKKMGNFKKALDNFELYQKMNDSIYNTENSKQIAEMQARFETEKKAKEIDLLTKDKKIKEDELTQQRIISWSIGIGGFLVLLLAILAIRGYIQKRKVYNELGIKNKKIETAYNIIEDQHKDIKDSIRYAQRLQEAILPTAAFNSTFKDNAFVFYKPKDIVSGDFYWIEEVKINNSTQILFAAVDCTGHGVPGAFMSIVGHNLLNQAVNEHHKIKPSDILNELNIGLSETLRQTQEDSAVKDGMDIALCSLKKNNSNSFTLQFAGANNPVWIVRSKQIPELIEIKGDKFPIGIFVGEELHLFNNHEVELFPGDTVYIFTDGFADQFGGAKGKKFKYKPLQELIISIQEKSMKQQQQILSRTLNDWKGDLEQVDDILVIGIKI